MHSLLTLLSNADVSGVVAAVGSDVRGFEVGDRIASLTAGFVTGNNDEGAFQEYSLARAEYTTLLPEDLDYRESAGLPQATNAAAMALYDALGLDLPDTASTALPELTSSSPIFLVWGAASSVGAMAVQFARATGFEVYAVASAKNHAHLHSLGASVTADYNDPSAESQLIDAAKKAGKSILYSLETVGTAEVQERTLKVLSAAGAKKFGHLLPVAEGVSVPEGISACQTHGDHMLTRRPDLGKWLYGGYLPKALREGTIKPCLPAQVVEGGLEGLQDAMDLSKNGVSGVKPIVLIT